jgi:hypothetical protein
MFQKFFKTKPISPRRVLTAFRTSPLFSCRACVIHSVLTTGNISFNEFTLLSKKELEGSGSIPHVVEGALLSWCCTHLLGG